MPGQGKMVGHPGQVGVAQTGQDGCFMDKLALGSCTGFKVFLQGTNQVQLQIADTVNRPKSTLTNQTFNAIAVLDNLVYR